MLPSGQSPYLLCLSIFLWVSLSISPSLSLYLLSIYQSIKPFLLISSVSFYPNHNLPLSLSLSLSLSFCHSPNRSPSLSPYISLHLFLSVTISMFLNPLFNSVSLHLFLSATITSFLSLYPSLSLFISFFLPQSQPHPPASLSLLLFLTSSDSPLLSLPLSASHSLFLLPTSPSSPPLFIGRSE